MCSIGEGVLANTSLLYVEAGITEEFLAEGTELLCRQLAHEQLLCVAAIARIASRVADFIHAASVPLRCDAQGIAQVHRINALLFLHHHHYVIGRLIVHQQFAVAVDYGTTGREKDMFEESIAVGILLEILAKQLQGEEPEDICEYDYAGDAPQHILAFAQFILLLLHCILSFFLG